MFLRSFVKSRRTVYFLDGYVLNFFAAPFACCSSQGFYWSLISATVGPRFKEPLYNDWIARYWKRTISLTPAVSKYIEKNLETTKHRYSEHVCQSLSASLYRGSTVYATNSSFGILSWQLELGFFFSSFQGSVNTIQTLFQRPFTECWYH